MNYFVNLYDFTVVESNTNRQTEKVDFVMYINKYIYKNLMNRTFISNKSFCLIILDYVGEKILN